MPSIYGLIITLDECDTPEEVTRLMAGTDAIREAIPPAVSKLREMADMLPEIKNLLSFISWEKYVTEAQVKRIHDLLAKIEKWENG